MSAPLIVGLSGPALTDGERAFLKTARPVGIIIFRRNVSSRDQLRALVSEARALCDARFTLVDQEGGRVQRIRPPLARAMPPASRIGELFAANPKRAERAAFLAGRLIMADLHPYGLDIPCLPVADVRVEGASNVIGDRAYGFDAETVGALAAAAAEGVLAGGGLPVAKHAPGHGRALVDSHLALPVVDAEEAALEQDFAPFRALSALPFAMTAHVVYSALDDRPATLSPVIIGRLRDIGLSGCLLTDDISMGALCPGGPGGSGDPGSAGAGSVAENGAAALQAGCDIVLHCNGDLDEMNGLAARLPPMRADSLARLDAADAARRPPDDSDPEALAAELASLIGPF